MPMLLMEGAFSILNAAPDGDSIRFIPDDPSLWQQVRGHVRPNRSGSAQLRLDAIDSLETHFSVPGVRRRLHQPEQWGNAAADRLLEFLGFDLQTIQRGREQIITAAQPATVPGYILTRFADRNGRAIAFAFAGRSPQPSGDWVKVQADWLPLSVNHHLLAAGLVYPTLYSKLYPDLREALILTAHRARLQALGLWPEDVSCKGFQLESLSTLTQDVVILPKLFRRLVSYWLTEAADRGTAGIQNSLKAIDDRAIVHSTGERTSLDRLLEVKHDWVRLTVQPENLVFVEK
ncbi:nuclease [Alkalinema sp. FACHB-956]|uniref:nuclease n=1 Tax=Alkalinema sp. FACHB-956 TaxID=2692768 RepID=UPI001683EA9A|nr:nuclease [Alkalinema sp. FACHB-956]MBD2329783.1 nuclease [Alkalinema sp. FACHB-956]